MKSFRRSRRDRQRYDLTISKGGESVCLTGFATRDHAQRAAESVCRYNPVFGPTKERPMGDARVRITPA